MISLVSTIVIYKSISGFTKKYAEWIAEECKADFLKPKKSAQEDSLNIQLSFLVEVLHAVGINGIKLIKENLSILAAKKIVIFAVGASPPRKEIINEILENNFSEVERAGIKLFYL